MSAERGGLPYLFGIAEVIAITSGTEEDLEWAAKFREARAAVAELIEAANKPAVAYGCLSSTGVHFVSDDRDDCVEESRRDGSLVVEMIVRPTRALARIGGAS